MEKRTKAKRIRRRAAVAAAVLCALLALGGCAERGDPRGAIEDGLGQISGVARALARAGEESAEIAQRQERFRRERRAPAGAKEHAERKKVDIGPEGTAGRLAIPSVGINVALNLAGADAQAVTDAPDSACWMERGFSLNPVIGDHVNQDFAALFSVTPGDSCTIVKDGRAYKYRCVAVGYGQNTEEDVIAGDGVSVFQRGEDRLCMYTCANGWSYVFIAEWQCESPVALHQLSFFFSDDQP